MRKIIILSSLFLISDLIFATEVTLSCRGEWETEATIDFGWTEREVNDSGSIFGEVTINAFDIDNDIFGIMYTNKSEPVGVFFPEDCSGEGDTLYCETDMRCSDNGKLCYKSEFKFFVNSERFQYAQYSTNNDDTEQYEWHEGRCQ